MIMQPIRRTPVLVFLIVTACLSRSAPQTQVAADAPSIPAELNLPETNVLTAPAPDDSEVLYYRNVVLVAFDDTVSGRVIRAFFKRYDAVIIGGADFVGPRGGYVLQIPDPGPSLDFLDAVLKGIEKEPGVAEATWLTYKDRVSPLRADVSRQSASHENWPLLIDHLPLLDTSRVIRLPGGTLRIYRTDISLTFKAGISDSAKASFFRRHSMRVIGVTQSGRFFVRIPDPGPTVEALYAVIDSLRREPAIALAGYILRDPLKESVFSRP